MELARDTVEQVFAFMMDCLRAYYKDVGFTPEVFEAVLVQHPTQPFDFDRRVRTVNHFLSLAAANIRIANILRQAAEKGINVPDAVDSSRLVEPAEQALAEQVCAMEKTVTPLFDECDYEPALAQLAGLLETVDRFFDDVMVMTDDAALRDNRLALLAQLQGLFLRVADLSQLPGRQTQSRRARAELSHP